VTDPKTKALLKARAAEAAGQHAEAIELFKAGGLVEDAARVLAAAGKPLEAAQLLLSSLGVKPSQVGTLEVKLKARAMKAAIQLVRAGELQQGVEIFVALGERARAVQALERAGDHAGVAKLLSASSSPGAPAAIPGRSARPPSSGALPATGLADSPVIAQKLEATGRGEEALEMWLRLKRFNEGARLAKSLGRMHEAATLFADAGMPLDAAQIFLQLGEKQRCLEMLLLVGKGDRRYRQAALDAAGIAIELDQVGGSLHPFLTPLLEGGPLSDKEFELFDELSRLFLRHDAPGLARLSLEKLVEKKPRFRDAARRLAALSREGREEPTRPGSGGAAPAPARAGSMFAADPLDLGGLPEYVVPPPQEETGAHAEAGLAEADLEELPAEEGGGASGQGGDLFFGGVPQPFEELEPILDLDEPLPPSRPPPAKAAAPASPAAPPAAASPPGAAQRTSATSNPPPPGPARPAPVAQPAPAAPARAAPAPIAAGVPPAVAAALAAKSGALRTSNPTARPPSAVFAPGLLVANRYRLEQKIGQGGMAAVFRATDLELEEQVALKVFSMTEATDVAVARFKLELKLSRQLSHPNIIRLYDIGLHDGHRYISMELLRGRSLKARMAEPFDFIEALRLLEQACAALQAAHDQGVIHRDVKPDNFFLTSEGVLKVMDFGIAKHQAAQSVTVVGSIAGTPAYMSPEQISNFSTVSHKTDLYALGVILYEVFTGTQPFNHPELVPLLLLHVNQLPEPPRQRNPGIPEELEAVILKLLEKDPARRHQAAQDVAEDLARIRRSYGG
jgi:serine/threonine-protein kinase